MMHTPTISCERACTLLVWKNAYGLWNVRFFD